MRLTALVIVALALGTAARPAWAQRAAVPDDFPGITRCEAGQAISRIRADVQDSLLRAQLEAHEAVHRAQAAAFPSCEAFVAGLTSARHIIDVELVAYCAQWRVAVGQGAEPAETRREYAWRIAAQSGAMENRLQVVQRFERECDLAPAKEQGRGAPGCPEMAELRHSLDSLEAHNPVDDARAAVSGGDYRFWAVMGHDVVVPSIPEDRRLELTPVDYRVFEHTGDGRVIPRCETTAGSVVDSTDVRWNQVTHAYAAIYNQTLVRLGH